jgi:molecular chaperone GrpE
VGDDTENQEGEALNTESEAVNEDAGGSAEESKEEKALLARIDSAVEDALAQQQDSVLRAQAEVQNMRRRCQADVEKAHKFGVEKFSNELLSVMDNLERALQIVPDSSHENVKGLYEGIELTMKELLDVFGKFNIEQIDPEGEPFDPQNHQAMSMVENLEVEPNTVLTVMQKGYSLNGRVIRPAMVMVSKS